jgi:ankyrin repeat protein
MPSHPVASVTSQQMLVSLQSGREKSSLRYLRYGADPNACIPDKELALSLSLIHGMKQMPHALLAAGANPNQKSALGNTPLLAVLLARPDVSAEVAMLLETGADPNLCEPNDGYTPLHLAVLSQQLPLISQLLAGGADPLLVNKQGQTASSLARSLSSFQGDTMAAALEAHEQNIALNIGTPGTKLNQKQVRL